MDVSAFATITPAPVALFEHLEQRAAQPRYQLPSGEGGWRPVTYREHADEVRAIAMYLIGRGHRPGQRAAIFAHNSVQWMSAALGVQAAGMVMVPIYPASTPEQAAYVTVHCDAKVVFVAGTDLLGRVFAAWPSFRSAEIIVVLDDTEPTQVLADLEEHGDIVPTAAEVERKLVSWSEAIRIGRGRDREGPAAFDRALAGVELDQPAIMLYTSGTTGNPKGVPLTHRNVGSNSVDWLHCNAPVLPEDGVDLLWLPMSHIFGYGEACLGNLLGWTTYMAEPSTVLGLLPSIRPNIFMSVPAYWEKLAAPARAAGSDAAAKQALMATTGGRLQFCLSGGAGLELEIKELFHRCGILIIEGYGLTECAPTLTLNRPDAFRFDSVGRPLPSVELKLAEDGEILARGPNVFNGYHHDRGATSEAFTADGWFKTGDVGRFTDDGFLQIVDRKKEILVTAGGKNVPPANIERHFAADPLFEHVVVYGDGKKFLTAGVWLHEPEIVQRLDASGRSAAEREQLRQSLVQRAIDAANAKLARFEQIKRFRIMERPLTVEAGLLTSTLKLRRKKIYEAFEADYEELYR
jgi:long-chain acyl-CoA synthetase